MLRMKKSDIRGTYNLKVDLSTLTSSFSFTGNNRQTYLTPSSDNVLTFRCETPQPILDNRILFLPQNKLTVKRARVITLGAPGLNPSKDDYAFKGVIYACDANNSVYSNLGTFGMTIPFYNEWQTIDQEFLMSKENAELVNYYTFNAGNNDIVLSVDDYNIQTAYIGESFKPILEIEIDTAGLHPYTSLNPYEVF